LIKTHELPELPKFVAPLHEQLPNESRKVWGDVMDSITSNEEEKALRAKTNIEDGQRKLRKDKKKSDENWTPKYFIKQGEFWVFPELTDIFGNEVSLSNIEKRAKTKKPIFKNQVEA